MRQSQESLNGIAIRLGVNDKGAREFCRQVQRQYGVPWPSFLDIEIALTKSPSPNPTPVEVAELLKRSYVGGLPAHGGGLSASGDRRRDTSPSGADQPPISDHSAEGDSDENARARFLKWLRHVLECGKPKPPAGPVAPIPAQPGTPDTFSGTDSTNESESPVSTSKSCPHGRRKGTPCAQCDIDGWRYEYGDWRDD